MSQLASSMCLKAPESPLFSLITAIVLLIEDRLFSAISLVVSQEVDYLFAFRKLSLLPKVYPLGFVHSQALPIMSTSQLCQICLGCLCDHVGLQTLEGQSGMMFFHHFTPGTLEASANAKCPICVLLWKQLQPLQSQITYESSKDKPLTFLLLQPSESLGIEGSYELAAYINDDATTADGIERASVLIFLLQAPEGASQSCPNRK